MSEEVSKIGADIPAYLRKTEEKESEKKVTNPLSVFKPFSERVQEYLDEVEISKTKEDAKAPSQKTEEKTLSPYEKDMKAAKERRLADEKKYTSEQIANAKKFALEEMERNLKATKEQFADEEKRNNWFTNRYDELVEFAGFGTKTKDVEKEIRRRTQKVDLIKGSISSDNPDNFYYCYKAATGKDFDVDNAVKLQTAAKNFDAENKKANEDYITRATKVPSVITPGGDIGIGNYIRHNQELETAKEKYEAAYESLYGKTPQKVMEKYVSNKITVGTIATTAAIAAAAPLASAVATGVTGATGSATTGTLVGLNVKLGAATGALAVIYEVQEGNRNNSDEEKTTVTENSTTQTPSDDNHGAPETPNAAAPDSQNPVQMEGNNSTPTSATTPAAKPDEPKPAGKPTDKPADDSKSTETDKTKPTEKPADSSTPATEEKPVVTPKPTEEVKPAVQKPISANTTKPTEKPTEQKPTEKPSEKPEVTSKSADASSQIDKPKETESKETSTRKLSSDEKDSTVHKFDRKTFYSTQEVNPVQQNNFNLSPMNFMNEIIDFISTLINNLIQMLLQMFGFVR